MNIFILMAILTAVNCSNEIPNIMEEIQYTFPEESEPHEGTWLQWPHHYQYGKKFRDDLDPTWVQLTKELSTSEKVYIIAYNTIEKDRIIALLNTVSVNLSQIDFKIYPNDDVWIRDNGPIYVRNKNGDLVIEDWGFNGWGGKTDFEQCDIIPQKVGRDQGRQVVNLNNTMINEGGSIELDGNGTLMGCKSSILNKNRNPGMTQKQAEEIFTKYLGATNFIWLDGQAGLDTTDQHIDGFARFGNSNTIIRMKQSDLLNYDVKQSDIDKLYSAKNKNGIPYSFLKVPLTQNNVTTTNGTNLGYKGSYINYYIANTKIIVPNYNDINDVIANSIIQSLYPTRTVVGIDVRNLYENGGMIHCITQQQPIE